MIYDTLAHIQAYRGIHPGVYRGLELLRDTATTFPYGQNSGYYIIGDRGERADRIPPVHPLRHGTGLLLLPTSARGGVLDSLNIMN